MSALFPSIEWITERLRFHNVPILYDSIVKCMKDTKILKNMQLLLKVTQWFLIYHDSCKYCQTLMDYLGFSKWHNFYEPCRNTGNNTFTPTTWTVNFDLPEVVDSNSTYTLQMALASANMAEVQVLYETIHACIVHT